MDDFAFSLQINLHFWFSSITSNTFSFFFQFYKETLDTSNDEITQENVEVPDIKIGAYLFQYFNSWEIY